MIRTIAIDADAPSRAHLCHLLSAMPGVALVGDAATPEAALALLQQTDCELIFLDASINPGATFSLLTRLPARIRTVITASHGDLALRAFEVNALDYLLKPITPERLNATLARLDSRAVATAVRHEETIHLRDGGRARLARINEICAIRAQENYTRVFLCDGSNVLVRRTLKEWDDLLPRAHFQQVHRTAIVNLNSIRGYRRDNSGGVELDLGAVGTNVPVGRTYWGALRSRLSPTVFSATPFPSFRDSTQPWTQTATEIPGELSPGAG